MPSLFVNKPNTRVSLASDRLQIKATEESGKDALLRDVPIRDVERVLLVESVQLSSQALAVLMKRSVPVTLYGWNGKYLGGFHLPMKPHGLARLNQYRRTGDGVFALQATGRIIAAKIYNQRRILQRLIGNRKRQGKNNKDNLPAATKAALVSVENTLQELNRIMARLKKATGIETLRGQEGASTALYFSAWAKFLPSAFPFERRSKRPPLNSVNACISFGATLIYNEAVSYIQAHGLDPALGFLHATDNSRWSLALDLIEPFRPVIVEALTLDTFSHNLLKIDDFEERDGGVYLTEKGRRVFIQQYESRLERQFMSECAGHRTTLRQQLENQAIMYKASLDAPEKFEPFLIN